MRLPADFFLTTIIHPLLPPHLIPYSLELLAVPLVLLYVATYILGTGRNKRLAYRWYDEVLTILADNFASLGDGHGALLRDGHAQYIAFATGRVKCDQLVARLSLKNRQDLVAVVHDALKVANDTVTFEVVLDAKASDNFVFGLFARGCEKDWMDRYAAKFGFDKFTKPLPTSYLPGDKFAVHTEHQDLVHAVFSTDPRVHRFLSNPQVQRRLESLVISDQVQVRDPEDDGDNDDYDEDAVPKITRKVLSLTYRLRITSRDLNLPVGHDAWAVHRAFAEFVVWLVDHVTQIEVRSDVKIKMRKRRQEEADKREVEAARARREREKKMSPDEIRRQEERRAERRQKRSRKQVVSTR
ncbi:hypothetical protein BCR44DRAFT_69925 [Catenaria anguillulae PL171]|uniref:DUF1682-domain-containing protein n=1 Tax=Catenaria anguillulae PL171 TaxID=765915 RepID=A0A1Y2HKL5_9FUNG|nr:hypothetical protein BCR44DRAFT_69925 [Catenaria anguillulae PL171]